MNIRCLLQGTSGAQQFPKSAVRRLPFLVQSVSHQKLSEPRFCRGTHRSYEVRPVKILGFHKAFVDQDLITESLRSSYSYIPIRSRQTMHSFAICYLWFIEFTDSWQKKPLLSFLRKTRHSSAQLCPRQQTMKIPKAQCSSSTKSPECH